VLNVAQHGFSRINVCFPNGTYRTEELIEFCRRLAPDVATPKYNDQRLFTQQNSIIIFHAGEIDVR
jgi:hypothetical protein